MKSSPYRIVLINMPFARLSMPSIALTQLSSLLHQKFGNSVEIKILYLNLDFQAYLEDISLYDHSHSSTAFMTGIGEWFFRQSAFPDAEDNTETYFDRYYATQDRDTQETWHRLLQKRQGINDFIDRMIDSHKLLDVDLVGFTALFSQTTASIAMARRIKERNPDVHTVIGGPPCDAVMGMTLAENVSSFDAVFSGPALISFPDFVDHISRGETAACDKINGVFTRSNRNRWPERGNDNPIGILGDTADINALIPLDYDSFMADLNTAFPNGNIRPALLFETSRGCWWAEKKACSFCGLNGPQTRHRAMTPEKAIAHIESLYRYVPLCIIFMGVDTSLPRGYTKDVFPYLKPPTEMNLFYELRPDTKKAEIKTLVNAGVRAFQPGIESLSTSSLKLMNKGTSAFQNIMFLKNCSAHPVRIDWNLLLFTPGEDEAVYEKALQDIPNLTHLAPPSGAYPVGFVRFSRYFENPADYGLDLGPEDFYGLTYPFDDNSVSNMAYHFVNHREDTARVNAWLQHLNAGVKQWTTRWLGSDNKPQARLCFASDGTSWAVYDSRSGQETETEITKTEKSILDTLNRPRTKESLTDTHGPDSAAILKKLQKQNWLFKENNLYLSLIT